MSLERFLAQVVGAAAMLGAFAIFGPVVGFVVAVAGGCILGLIDGVLS